MIQLVSPPATAAAPDQKAAAQQKKLKSAAQAFEAVFLRQMISSMRDANLGDGMFDNEGTDTFQTMADGKTADAMSGKGVLGIADMLLKQLGPIAAKDAAKTGDGLAAASSAATAAETTETAGRATALAMPGRAAS